MRRYGRQHEGRNALLRCRQLMTQAKCWLALRPKPDPAHLSRLHSRRGLKVGYGPNIVLPPHLQHPQNGRPCTVSQPATHSGCTDTFNPPPRLSNLRSLPSTHMVRPQPRQRVQVGAVGGMRFGVARQCLRLVAQPGGRAAGQEPTRVQGFAATRAGQDLPVGLCLAQAITPACCPSISTQLHRPPSLTWHAARPGGTAPPSRGAPWSAGG